MICLEYLTEKDHKNVTEASCNSCVPILLQTYLLATAMGLDYFMSSL